MHQIFMLIYFQTSLNNVLQWVKVDNNTVDTFYRHLRCICIACVQEEIVNLGGENKAIELGVISLGMILILYTLGILLKELRA